MKAELHPTPTPKMPEHLSTVRPDSQSSSRALAGRTPATNREEKIDKQMQDSFPASDPPSFSGGNHIIGAPTERESDAPDPDAVKNAERKVKDGTAKEAHKY